MSEKYFIKDIALKEKSKDAFHHLDFVKNLKMIIEEHTPPFNIALLGKWGVGKSSIVNLLKTELEGKDEYKIHEINAWKYENDSLRKAFLKNLWKTLNDDKEVSLFKQFADSFRNVLLDMKQDDELNGFKKAFKLFFPYIIILTFIWLLSCFIFLGLFVLVDYASTFFYTGTFNLNIKQSIDFFKDKIWIPLGIAPFFTLFLTFINTTLQNKKTNIQLLKPIETADEYEDLFKEEIKKHKDQNPNFKKLVVIIDDLDRLSPKKVVDALDAIKAFVDVEECIFIVTCDEDILIRALEKKRLSQAYDDIDGELFLDKLFQFRLTLPPIIESDMREYAAELVKQEAPGLLNLCNGNFNEIIKILIHPEVTTPRQVKKLVNTFTSNLLIAKSREREERKLENELLTGERGMRILAKLSVLQSDYNDIYSQLVNNYSIFEDILSIYYNGDISKASNKKALRLFHSKDSKYIIKDEYQGLINFLIMTEHITVENLAPFIYLGQDTIGLLAGDENLRKIRRNLISGNDKGIVPFLQGEGSNRIALALVEEVKTLVGDDLPLAIKASFQIISYLPEDTQPQLADVISIRLQEVDLKKVRLWQVNYDNLLSVYTESVNKRGAKAALIFAMTQLYNINTEWMNKEGKEMSNEEFIQNTFDLNDILLKNSDRIEDEIKSMVKSFIHNQDNINEHFPFEKIHHLYLENKHRFKEYFGLVFYKNLVEVVGNSQPKELLKELAMTLYSLAPIILQEHKTEFFDTIHIALSVDKEITDNIMKIILPHVKDMSNEAVQYIVTSFIELPYSEDDEISSLLEFLFNAPVQLGLDEEFDKKFDEFMLNILPSKANEQLEIITQLFERFTSTNEDGFTSFSSVFEYVIEQVLEKDIYDELISKVNQYFDDTQRTKFFDALNKGVLLNEQYNPNYFDRVYTLYSILVENDENRELIKGAIVPGITIFTSNRYSQNMNWANNFLKLLTITKKIIDENQILKLSTYLLNSMASSHPDLMIKGFNCLGSSLPQQLFTDAVKKAIDYAKTDAQKLDLLEFFNSNFDRFNSDDGTLSLYAEFVAENVALAPDLMLDSLFDNFSRIGKSKLAKLITNVLSFNDEISNLYRGQISRTLKKLFDALEDDNKYSILDELLTSNSPHVLNEILVRNINKRKELLEKLILDVQNKDMPFKLNLLTICSYYKDELRVNSFADLFASVFVLANDDDVELISNIAFTHFQGFRFNQSKKTISVQVVPLFKRVNESMKKKVVEIAKNFGLEGELKQARASKELTKTESEIVFKMLNLRR